jgi:hypothetical protein
LNQPGRWEITFREAYALTELNAFFAARLIAGSFFAMLLFDPFPVRTCVVVVIDLPMPRLIFG